MNDEQMHGAWDKEQQRYEDGCKSGDNYHQDEPYLSGAEADAKALSRVRAVVVYRMSDLATEIRDTEHRLQQLRAQRKQQIRDMASNGATQHQIAAHFRIAQPTVAYYLSGYSDPRPKRDDT